jgi:hypothetical protein
VLEPSGFGPEEQSPATGERLDGSEFFGVGHACNLPGPSPLVAYRAQVGYTGRMRGLVLAIFGWWPLWGPLTPPVPNYTQATNPYLECRIARVHVTLEAGRHPKSEFFKDSCRVLCSLGASCRSKGYGAVTFSTRKPYRWGVTCVCGDE